MLYDRTDSSISLVPSVSVRQGLTFLQTPVSELIELIRNEITLNPIFDVTSTDKISDSSLRELPFPCEDGESWWEKIPAPVSPINKIYQQLCLITSCHQKLQIAQNILGNIDERGFLRLSISEISILSTCEIEDVQTMLAMIQKCEPIGVGSRNLKEYLLIQLENTHVSKEDYELIRDYFDLLVDHKIEKISKKIKITREDTIIKFRKIFSQLQFQPLSSDNTLFQMSIPDAYIYITANKWHIRINDFILNNLRINGEYLKIVKKENNVEYEKYDYLEEKILSAKHLIHNLNKRNETLLHVLTIITEKQADFLSGKDPYPQNLSIKDIAKTLNRHESTIFRAVKNKIISTPRGIIPLNTLIPQIFVSSKGANVQKTSLQNIIGELIKNEKYPLSDEQLVKELQRRGMSCARRTVAKYRKILNIPCSTRRL